MTRTDEELGILVVGSYRVRLYSLPLQFKSLLWAICIVLFVFSCFHLANNHHPFFEPQNGAHIRGALSYKSTDLARGAIYMEVHLKVT